MDAGGEVGLADASCRTDASSDCVTLMLGILLLF